MTNLSFVIPISLIHIYTRTPLFYFEFFQVFCVKTCWFRDFQDLIACWLLINQVLSRYPARFSSFSNPLSRFQELIHTICTRFLEFLCYWVLLWVYSTAFRRFRRIWKFGVCKLFRIMVRILKGFSSILGLVWIIGELWDFVGFCGIKLAIYNLINF